MITRNGKIARLPRELREQLNQRLSDGEPGGRLVEWLNARAEVQAVLEADFGGRPINEQNLSEWRQGGYADWVKQQERRNLVRQLTEDAGELDADAGGLEISNSLAAVLATELAASARELLATVTEPAERWARMQELLRELARLRREDARAGRLQILREGRNRERAQQEEHEAWRARFAASTRLREWDYLKSLFAQPDLHSQVEAMELAEDLLLKNGKLQPGSANLAPAMEPESK